MHAELSAGPPTQRTPPWATARRLLGWAFLGVVLWLLLQLGRRVDWNQAVESLRALPAGTLLAAAALCGVSHAFYACYDLIGRHQTGHCLTVPRTASVSFMSYAFNLNLGSLVGGVAFRYRLYSRLGLSTAVITRVLALSLVTNWLGYFALAGFTLLLWPPLLPEGGGVADAALPALGAVLLAAGVAYIAACFVCERGVWHRKASWQWRGHRISLPPGRIALLQLTMAATSWCVIASICWVLMQQRVEFTLVLGALLTAAVAGVITHVPAGLGVLEAVFALLLAPYIPQAELLGALLAYRALYYLMPLLAASALFVAVDLRRGKKKGGRSRLSV